MNASGQLCLDLILPGETRGEAFFEYFGYRMFASASVQPRVRGEGHIEARVPHERTDILQPDLHFTILTHCTSHALPARQTSS